MVRTQIQVTEQQWAFVKDVAAKEHVSMAEVIRQGIDTLFRAAVTVRPEERVRRAIKATGRFHSGRSDVSARHDDHLADAYKS